MNMNPSFLNKINQNGMRTNITTHLRIVRSWLRTTLQAMTEGTLPGSAQLLVGLALLSIGCSGQTADSSTGNASPNAPITGHSTGPNVPAPNAEVSTPPSIPQLVPAPEPPLRNTTALKLDTRISVVQFIDLHPQATELFGGDADFKRYIREYWSTWVDFEEQLFDHLETMNTLWYDNERMKKVQKSEDLTETLPETYRQVKSLFKNAWSVGKTVRDGMSLLDLEKQRNALLNSYSNEKQDWAMAIEILMNSVIHDVYYAPLNEEMKSVKAGKHFRSAGDELLVDTDASRYISGLQRDMIKLQGKYRELRAAILLNKLVDKKQSYPELASTCQAIMRAKGPIDFQFEPRMVQGFVRDYQKLRLELLKAEDRERFRTDHWSAKKRKNFTAIVADIKTRMGTMAKDVNGPYRQHTWDPWTQPRKKA